MGKKHRYKDTKEDDKFHAVLAGTWARIEPYALKIGIGLAVVLVVAIVWMLIASHLAKRADRPWARRFEIHQETRAPRPPERGGAQGEARASPEEKAEFEKTRLELQEKCSNGLTELASEYKGDSVAAITLLDLSGLGSTIGKAKRSTDAAGAASHFLRAAEAGEQFLADFPDHLLLGIAANNAGKARLELADVQHHAAAAEDAKANFEAAAQHFQMAAQRFQQDPGDRCPYLVAFARFHEALCYEFLQRPDEARRLFEEVRKDAMAGWFAQQAQFHLIQLDRQPDTGG